MERTKMSRMAGSYQASKPANSAQFGNSPPTRLLNAICVTNAETSSNCTMCSAMHHCRPRSFTHADAEPSFHQRHLERQSATTLTTWRDVSLRNFDLFI